MNSLIAACVLTCASLGADPAADEATIQGIFTARAEAWAQRDLEGLMKDMAEDADTVDSSGKYTRGREAIRARYAEMLKHNDHPEAKFVQEVTQVRMHGADLAVTDGDWEVINLKDAEGKPLPDRNGHSVVVLVRTSGKWQIAALRSYIRK